MQHEMNPYDMRGEDWFKVAVFLANAVAHLAPTKADDFLRTAESIEHEWSDGNHFAEPWDLSLLDSGTYNALDRRVRCLLPDPIYRAFAAARADEERAAVSG